MKRIGLASVYNKRNYGSILQTFALQKVIQNSGYECEIFDTSHIQSRIKRKRFEFYVRNLFNIRLYMSKKGMVLHKIRCKLNHTFGTKIASRNAEFSKFIMEKINFSEAFPSFSKLSEQCHEYDAIGVGSDQLWLPVNICGGFYTLEYVPETIPSFSYATSFGVSSIPSFLKSRTKAYLNKIHSISVREQTGTRIVHEMTGRDVPVVGDPIMLLSRDEWDKEIPDKSLYTESYIFCYFLGKTLKHREYAKKLAQEKRLKLVVLRHLEEYVAEDEKYGDYAPYDVDPFGLINLIRHATYICTDSFHASVFSIINHRQFLTFPRFADGSPLSTNERITSLLTFFSLINRWICSDKDFKKAINTQIDYSAIQASIEEFRTDSIDFLMETLKGRNSDD